MAQNGSLTLAAGSYGLLKVNQKATIIFSGGEYHFAAWDVGQQVNLFFQAASDIRSGSSLFSTPPHEEVEWPNEEEPLPDEPEEETPR